MTALVLMFMALLTQADGNYQRFSTAFDALDERRVAAIYTEDALYLPPSGDMLRGRAAIQQKYARAFEHARDRGDRCRISFEFVDRAEAGDSRTDIGYYTIVTTEPGGHTDRFRGKFVKVWRRDRDGVWRIRIDGYSPASNL